MKQISKYFRLFVFLFVLVLVLVSNASIYRMTSGALKLYPPPDTIEPDTNEIELIYPFQDDPGNPFQQPDTNALFLKTPSNIETVVEYDPETGQYIFKKKIGDFYYRDPTYMSLDEYRRYELNQSIKNYWKERSLTAGQDQREGIIPQIHIANKAFDKIFGGSTIDIRPQGSAEITFGVLANRRDDPLLNVRQQRTVNFDFKEKIQMNVVAKIGDKIEFKTNYNTESQFDFENKLKLKYEGDEDDIIKLIEAGDVSLPLNTSLITGSQALFGVKTRLQFGRTTVTGVFSQQESESSTITVEGGAQRNEFELTALDYEENRHFFLARYFRGQYEGALAELPVVSSDINITKMEVWLTNVGAAVTENRNIVAFTDLGSYDPYNDKIQPNPGRRLPSNNTNNLIAQLDTTKVRDINLVSNYLKGDPFGIGQGGYMVSGEDFEKVESARKLEPSEYTINSKLGFISLNTNLNSDQVLAVAFQYTKIGDTAVYQVGEFSDQGITSPNCLIVKLLKSTSLNVNNPLWTLMMKNVYNIGAYQVNQQDFMLNIFYSGNENGVPTAYFTEGPEDVKGVPLLRLFNFDKLDQQMNPFPDGMFDFINGAATSGGTIQASNGRVYFTVLEPFGSHMREIFEEDTSLASKYAYDSLYTLTKTGAEQFPDKNKYLIQGYYKSSVSNEISLNAFNVPRGSVTVTAGGRQLVENVDYTVDYTLGRVRIINEGILNSGTPIKINLENNALFSIQTKRLMGLNFEHRISENFNFGGTILNLTERPLTQKTNYGDSPISNTIYGFNLDYETESRWLTKMVDNIPLIETKAPSRISMEGEFAHFLPGHSRAIGKTGTSYIDDFEGSKSTIDLKNIGSWFLASTPQGQTELFPEAAITEGINYGKNRARLAWYIIDPIFYDRTGNLRPPNITIDEISKNSVRQVLETEIFPEKELPSGQPTNIPILNLAYYPDERGPYNYDVEPVSGISAGIDDEGRLQDPDSRWGGMMRKIESSDFEATNVEYIEFWMMDPFTDDSANSGKLYINLGDVSEDILRDGRKSFENGLPTGPEVTNVDTTIWGRVPTVQALVESFDDQPSSRPYQDVGYDGLMDDDERSFLESNPYGNNYLALIRQKYLDGEITAEAFDNVVADPSADNYKYFRGEAITETSIAERYKNYNNPDGNSPTDEQNPEPYPIAATTLPNVEDINRDNTLSEAERYYQYVVELDPDKMKVGENYIADIQERVGLDLPNKETTSVKWYQFKIPVRSPDKVVGNIQDFRSIRFMRVFMKDFEKPVICRFATLELVRGEWRRYNQPLLAPGEYIPSNQQAETQFDISAVNLEENSGRSPVSYELPPGIDREINIGTTNLTQQNEQSMVLKVIDLTDGAAKGAFKTTDFDFRQYGHLKMFVHAEKIFADENLDYGDMTVFIRFGSDLTENYYEYELPLTFTDWSPGEVVRDPALIWPEANNVDIDLEKIVQIKQNRNVKMRDPNSNLAINRPYIEYEAEGDGKITVLGVPSISDVKAIMIGVRNPKKQTLQDADDGNPKSVEVWINELRLTDFNKKGGWAASARVSANLADLGRVTVSGMHSTPNFGSLDQKIDETQREAVTQFDISTDVELGKFFPEETGIKIPMHFDYSETHVVPQYNPLDPDIKLKDELDTYDSEAERDSLKKITQEFVQRKSINFMNVRKTRTNRNKKPKIYDIENFNFSYAYSEVFIRNIDVEFDIQKIYNGGFGYAYNSNPKNIKPLAGIGFLKSSDLFKIIRDFNFYYLPKSLAFRTDMYREINERKLRNKSIGLVKTETYTMKRWDWNRTYELKYDLTQNLNIEYSANAKAYIDEPQGLPDKGTSEYEAYKDTIRNEIFNFGSIDRYNQTISANYRLPINKIPFLDWVNLQAGYKGQYSWTASPKSIRDRVGNQIQNSNTIQINGDFSLDQLYDKIPYLSKLNEGGKGGGRRPMQRPPGRQGPEEEKESDTTDQEKGTNYLKFVADNILRIATGVKKASFTYSETNGTFLPGFVPEPNAIGINWKYTPDTSVYKDPSIFGGEYPTSLAPGIGFVFGDQRDITNDAFRYGWITPDTLVNQAFATKHSDNLNMRLTYEPFRDLRLEISADRAYSNTFEAFLRMDTTGEFNRFSEMERGSFSMSYLMIGTAFTKDIDNNISEVFENFKEYRTIIADRLAGENPNWNGEYVTDTVTVDGQRITRRFPLGYGPTQQEVLQHAFLAAYSGKQPGDASLVRFPKLPLPNWRLTFSGLINIPFIKERFRKITISHGYMSAYNVAGFTRYTEYAEKNGHPSRLFANSQNFIPKYDISAISVTEQFSPLIGLDVTMNNNMSTKLEYKKARNLAFSFINNQLTEVKSDEFIVGMGYKIKDVSFSFITSGGRGSSRRVKSDLDIRADFSIRSNKTILRRLDEDVNQISSGQKIVSINTSADYNINQRFNIRLFFDKVINNPFVSNQYRNSTTNGGITLRFTLSQ